MPEVRSRSRKWVHSYPYHSVSRWGQIDEGVHVLTEQQWTEDEVHDWYGSRRSGRDIGGPFNSTRTRVEYDFVPAHQTLTGYYGETWSGTVLPALHKDESEILLGTNSRDQVLFWTGAETLRLSDSLRLKYGTEAIDKTKPTNPMVDGSVALAELFREGLPSMVGSTILKTRIRDVRSLGGEYLNWEFGWKPLVADLKSAALAITKTEQFLAQLRRDSGRRVRRRFTFPDAQRMSYGADYAPPVNNVYRFWAGGRRTRVVASKTEVWFSGAYTFHYDPGDLSEISRIATQARLLYGLELTPEVVWNLAPWSWLVDWVGNVGPVLSNLSSFSQDGLVLRYGYLMDYTKDSWSNRHTGVVTARGQRPYGGDFGSVVSVETKRRTRATPYGFGLAIDGFSNRQWAILAALGLTRLPKQL